MVTAAVVSTGEAVDVAIVVVMVVLVRVRPDVVGFLVLISSGIGRCGGGEMRVRV